MEDETHQNATSPTVEKPDQVGGAAPAEDVAGPEPNQLEDEPADIEDTLDQGEPTPTGAAQDDGVVFRKEKRRGSAFWRKILPWKREAKEDQIIR